MKLEPETDAWELDDAEERHHNAPDHYPLPSLAERSRIKVGDRVELFFLFRGQDQHGLFIQSERLPVTVHAASPAGYIGTLDTAPICSQVLPTGDSIFFETRHITSIKPNERES